MSDDSIGGSSARTESSSLSEAALLDLARWLIDRHDVLRNSVATRAGHLLSADALILTATALVAGRFFTVYDRPGIPALLAICGAALLIASCLFAAASIVSPWKTSRELLGLSFTTRLFFNAADTLAAFSGPGELESSFREISHATALSQALHELWTAQTMYRVRYRRLRAASRLLFYSIFPLGAAVIAWLVEVSR